jgi:hypothetical protein
MRWHQISMALFAGFLSAVTVPVGHAAESATFSVSIDTMPLIAHPAGPFSLARQWQQYC